MEKIDERLEFEPSELLREAASIVQEFARANPMHNYRGEEQDPCGAHRWLEKYRATVTKDARPCTCHPDDNPPKPCQQKYALSECQAAAETTAQTDEKGRPMTYWGGRSGETSERYCHDHPEADAPRAGCICYGCISAREDDEQKR